MLTAVHSFRQPGAVMYALLDSKIKDHIQANPTPRQIRMDGVGWFRALDEDLQTEAGWKRNTVAIADTLGGLAQKIGSSPSGWTSPIPAGQKASREELFQLGRAIFDGSLPAPEASPDCLLMEAGGVVLEDPDYLAALFGGESKAGETAERVAIPAGIGPGRPSDPHARVVVIDEEQGIVVAIAVIPGFVSPYVIRSATESCFVPAEMMHMHLRTLDPEHVQGLVTCWWRCRRSP